MLEFISTNLSDPGLFREHMPIIESIRKRDRLWAPEAEGAKADD